METRAIQGPSLRSVRSPWLSTTALTPVAGPADTFTRSTVTAPPVFGMSAAAHEALSPMLTTAASVFSLAFLAVPHAALAQTASAAEPAAPTMSTVIEPPVQQKPQADAPAQQKPQADVPAQQKPQAEVPWYNPIEQRAHDINDGFGGFRSGVDAYRDRLNTALNDNALAKYQVHGQMGDYGWSFHGMRADVDPYLTLRANRVGAGVRADVSLLQGSIQSTTQRGDWTRTQGLRADLNARLEVGEGASLRLNGIHGESPRNHFIGPRVEAFQQWNLSGDHAWKVTADFNAGAAYDFSGLGTILYMRGLQRFENDQLTKKWLGEGSRVRFETEEGVQFNNREGQVRPYYKIFGGVGKPITVTLKGKAHVVDVETGLRAEGTRETPFKVRPEVRARVHW